MLLFDVSIEGPNNMWRVALQIPGPQKVGKYGKKVESWHMER